MKNFLNNMVKHWDWLLLGSVPAIIIILLLLTGIVNAYDAMVYNSLESSYTSNLKAMENVKTSCEASYQALLNYKKENKMEVKGSGSGCTFR